MTDPPSTGTHSTHHSVPALARAPSTSKSPQLNGISEPVPQDDPEDYTIKCICIYKDDDGSTVLCERCDTWQHIICYYGHKKVPEEHFCGDCEPRELDAKRATENQRRLREGDGGDAKSKGALKSHKKKKDHNVPETNGHGHARHESAAARDQPPPAKRAKTSHRASASVASLNGAPVLPDSRKRATSNANAYPSPTKSPPTFLLHPSIPMFTNEFLSLYENDPGKDNVDDGTEGKTYTNSMSVPVTSELTTWFDNPNTLKKHRQKHSDVFLQSDQPLRPESWPKASLKEKQNPEIAYDGRFPKWKYVVLDTNVKKDAFVGEIKGDIGLLEDYCMEDAGNRWHELRHPDPFVFFHPSIPIYIDSRAEGTQFRYVRRSCRPNLSLRTFVTGERDFHHCFVARENITSGTELTTSWYIDQALFEHGKVKEENGEGDEARRRATYFSKLLANFGGCACASADCTLKAHDLRTPPEFKKRDGRRGRAKSKNAASPPGTGHAVNSRANSEQVANYDDDQADSRSTSGSIRSKPQSRDITPANGIGPADTTEGSAGISAREKKKILMAEKAFEDQETKTKRPKRKRASNGPPVAASGSGSKPGAPSATSLPTTPSLAPRLPHLNTNAARSAVTSPPLSAPLRQSNNSPHGPSACNTPSPLAKSVATMYVDQGMQTDPDPEQAMQPPVSEPQLAVSGYEKYIPPMLKRLRRFQDWEKRDKARKDDLRRKIQSGGCSPYSSVLPTWLEERHDAERRRASSLTLPKDSDCAGNDLSNSDKDRPGDRQDRSASAPQPSYPLPSQAAHSHSFRPTGQKLQLSTVPPVPAFSTSTSSMTQTTTTFSPTPTTPSVSQSPFSHAPTHSFPSLSAGPVGPSPVKKKLSLGDYRNRRSNLTTPTTEKTLAQATEVALPTVPPISEAEATDLPLPTPATTETQESVDQSVPPLETRMDIDEGPVHSNALPTPDSRLDSTKDISMPDATQPTIASTMSPQLSSVFSNLQAIIGSATKTTPSGT